MREEEPIPELPSDLEKALDSEPEFIDASEKPNNLANRVAQDTTETVKIDPSARESGKYEDHIRRDTQIKIAGKERETETRQFAIGEGVRAEYGGQTALQYIVKNLVEKNNSDLDRNDPKIIYEGQYVQVIALGYRSEKERVPFISEEDSTVAESSIYQVTKHEEGYLWSEPAVGMSEIAGDLLQGHPMAKGLTPEERGLAQIWIQLAHIPDSKVIERIKLMNQGTATPLEKPEDAIGTLDKEFGDEAEDTLNTFFSEGKTPPQNPKPTEEPSEKLKRLSRKRFDF